MSGGVVWAVAFMERIKNVQEFSGEKKAVPDPSTRIGVCLLFVSREKDQRPFGHMLSETHFKQLAFHVHPVLLF